jgi:hypothetical protein
MANVYVEARPKGRPEGTAIEGYVVEDHIDSVLGSFTTQSDAIEWAKKRGHRPLVAHIRHLNEEEPRPLANRLGLFCPPLTLLPHLVRWLVLPQPDVDRVAKQSVGSPGQIRDFGHKPRLDPVHARQNKRRAEAGLPRW